jgi:hypothetical protein
VVLGGRREGAADLRPYAKEASAASAAARAAKARVRAEDPGAAGEGAEPAALRPCFAPAAGRAGYAEAPLTGRNRRLGQALSGGGQPSEAAQ